MLTAEEINEIETEAAHYPRRDGVCIDALKIVQHHRGWVCDESVRDIAAHLDMSATDLDSVATIGGILSLRSTGGGCYWPSTARAGRILRFRFSLFNGPL